MPWAGKPELIPAFVLGLNAFGYCHGAHVSTVKAFGLDGTLLTELGKD